MSDHSSRIIRYFVSILLLIGMTHSIWTQNWSSLIWEVWLVHYVWHTRLIEYYQKKGNKVAEKLVRYGYVALSVIFIAYIFLARYDILPNIYEM